MVKLYEWLHKGSLTILIAVHFYRVINREYPLKIINTTMMSFLDLDVEVVLANKTGEQND